MLNSFEITNFRLFQHLKVEKLSRVNLVVGKNNAGKSTFLEALELYASNGSANILAELVEARQESWFSEAQPHSQNFLSNPVRHLFFGHCLPKVGETGIVLGEISSDDKLYITTAAYQDKRDDEGNIRRIRLSNSQIDEAISGVEFFLVAEESEKTRILFRLNEGLRDIQQNPRILYGLPELRIKYTWQTVSTSIISDRKLAALWDLTSLTNLESEIISALGLIDNRISGVAFVEDMNRSRNRIPLVKIEGTTEPLPLKSMGDGITRLFHIIVALVNAKNGLLLIDEFENGLHWTVQPKLWNIVFQLSKRLNVQVFATTHSRDCIKGFDSAWLNYPELGSFFRFDLKDGFIRAREYTSETLTDAIDMDVEVR
jgi:AAA15 family ATPase/GTPase